MQRPKVIFMGSHPISLKILNYLQSCNKVLLTGVVSQPDRKSGRGQKVTANAVSQWAIDHEIPLYRPEKPKTETVNWMKDVGCDVILVMAYGHILGKSIREIPSHGIFNFHASILPRFRGAAPIEAAIASGATETGITLMEVVKEMDAGQIFDIEKIELLPRDNQQAVVGKLSQAAEIILKRNLPLILDRTIKGFPQDEQEVTYCRKIEKNDIFLDFSEHAKILVNRARALTPKPGVAILIDGETYKLETYEWTKTEEDRSYELFEGDGKLLVGCASNTAIVVDKMQKPGGRMLPSSEFIRGFKNFKEGMKVSSMGNVKPFESKTFPF